MAGWRDFQGELEGLDGEARTSRARQLIAAHQATISDDPPSWLLEAAGSRALEEDLQTEDVDAVDVLSIGGPVFGVGSPPGGEHITRSRLERIVADTRELSEAGELRGPVKLGHSQLQALLRASGITDGEMPAAGWVENVRLNEDGTRAVADLKRVPRVVAKLIRSGAYRVRSAELKRVLSQANGKTYEMVIGGLALMGAKAPAIRTLDDFVKLYGEDEEAGDLVGLSAPDDEGMRTLEERTAALRDAGLLADSETLRVEKARPADTSEQMPELTFTEEATRSLAETLGLEGDDVTPEKAAEAVAALKEKAEADPEQKRELEESDLARAFGEYREAKDEETAELKTQIETVQEERRLEQRDVFVEGLMRDGRVRPGDRKKWEDRFDKDAEMARSFAEDLEPDESLVREFGSEGPEDDEPDDQGKTKADRDYEEDAAPRLGVPAGELI